MENPSGIFYNSSKIRLRDWSYSSRVTSPFWYKSSSLAKPLLWGMDRSIPLGEVILHHNRVGGDPLL